MCDGDLDTILSHISSKINKIFCDREFVGCVKEDLDIIRQNDNYCVLFPKLKPIFLKVLRCQAVIFDLSVFCIGSGPNQVAVVCKKAILKEKTDECPSIQTQKVPKSMDAEENSVKLSQKKSNRVNRPTISYYVPPAQRSTPRKKADKENKISKKMQKPTSTHHRVSKKLINDEEAAMLIAHDTKDEEPQEQKTCEMSVLKVPHSEFHTSEQTTNKPSDILTASEDSSQIPNNAYSLPSNNCELLDSEEPIISQDEGLCIQDFSFPDSTEIDKLPKPEKVQCNEQLNLSLQTVQNKSSGDIDAVNADPILSTSSLNETNQLAISQCGTVTNDQQAEVQNSDANNTLVAEEGKEEVATSDIGDFAAESPIGDFAAESSIKSSKIILGLRSLYIVAEVILKDYTLNQCVSTNDESSPANDTEVEKVIKLLKTMLADDEEYEYEEEDCAMIEDNIIEVLKQKYIEYNTLHCIPEIDDELSKEADCSLFNSLAINDSKYEIDSSKYEIDSDVESITTPPPQVQHFQVPEQKTSDENNSDVAPLYISYNDDPVEKKCMDYDLDNEKEEMQRAIENINRKRRPLIKHIHNDNRLRISHDKKVTQRCSGATENNKNSVVSNSEKECNIEQNNLSNWEDMFDENGELQQEYIGEIVKHIGCEVKVVKASHDYSAYQNTKYQDLEHVIELYDFPSTFKTQDLMQLYRGAYQDAYIKWCDDTHALLVLSSPAQAQRALQMDHEIIKARPLSQASTVAALTASSSDLKPAMKRPQTSMQTARRLITTHLGTRSTLSKEEVQQERRALQDAREQRRLERQNEKDAWEGRPRNAKS